MAVYEDVGGCDEGGHGCGGGEVFADADLPGDAGGAELDDAQVDEQRGREGARGKVPARVGDHEPHDALHGHLAVGARGRRRRGGVDERLDPALVHQIRVDDTVRNQVVRRVVQVAVPALRRQ